MTFNFVSSKLNKCNMHSNFLEKLQWSWSHFLPQQSPPKNPWDILEGLTFGSEKLFSKSLKKHFQTRHGRSNTWIPLEWICRLIENENNLIRSSIQQTERGFTLHTLCFNCSQFSFVNFKWMTGRQFCLDFTICTSKKHIRLHLHKHNCLSNCCDDSRSHTTECFLKRGWTCFRCWMSHLGAVSSSHAAELRAIG